MYKVSLPMYAPMAAKEVTREWWRGIAQHLSDTGVKGVPEELETPDNLLKHWQSPQLLLSQTCGYPLVKYLQDYVTVIGTPVYDAPGCDRHFYSSAILVNRNSEYQNLSDLRGATAAYNSVDSQSGYNAMRFLFSSVANGKSFFKSCIESGEHAASIAAVAEGRADVCATDAVTLALLQNFDSAAISNVRRLHWSQSAPGLPLVISQHLAPDFLEKCRTALVNAFNDPGLATIRRALLLKDFVTTHLDDYTLISDQEKHACDRGYSLLH